MRICVVMTHHAQQGCAVAKPVPRAQLAGLLMVQLKVICEITSHLAIDLGQNVV